MTPSALESGLAKLRCVVERQAPTVFTLEVAEAAALLAELEKRQWQPMDSAPTGRCILLCWRGGIVSSGRYDEDSPSPGWRNDGDECIPRNQQDCIGWMPLPPPPKEQE